MAMANCAQAVPTVAMAFVFAQKVSNRKAPTALLAMNLVYYFMISKKSPSVLIFSLVLLFLKWSHCRFALPANAAAVEAIAMDSNACVQLECRRSMASVVRTAWRLH